jgi:hypothetical protein
MWQPGRLTTLWASTTCFRDSFTFFTFLYIGLVVNLLYQMSSPRFEHFRFLTHFVVWKFPTSEWNHLRQITLPYVFSSHEMDFTLMSIFVDSETLELNMGTCISSAKVEHRRKYTFYMILLVCVRSRDGAVGIATSYGLDTRGYRSSCPDRVKNFLFSTSSRPALGFTQPPMVTGGFFPGDKAAEA